MIGYARNMIIRESNAPKTLALVKASLKEVGVGISKREGEYRVCAQGHSEDAAYYTSSLSDAWITGMRIAHENGWL